MCDFRPCVRCKRPRFICDCSGYSCLTDPRRDTSSSTAFISNSDQTVSVHESEANYFNLIIMKCYRQLVLLRIHENNLFNSSACERQSSYTANIIFLNICLPIMIEFLSFSEFVFLFWIHLSPLSAS